MRAYIGCPIRLSPHTSWVILTKYLVAPRSLGRGMCTVGNSLEKGRGSPFSASEAFENLLAPYPMMKAPRAHYNPLEGPICGVFMITIVTMQTKTSCSPQSRANFELGQIRSTIQVLRAHMPPHQTIPPRPDFVVSGINAGSGSTTVLHTAESSVPQNHVVRG